MLSALVDLLRDGGPATAAVLAVVIALTALVAWHGQKPRWLPLPSSAHPSRRTSVVAALLLLVLAAAWMVADKGFEGPHLVRLSHKHGIVAADLVAILSVVLSVAVLVRAARRSAILEP